MKKLLLTSSVLILMSVGSALAGEIMPGDNGRWHGYMPSGYIGAHPSNRGVNSCKWSASTYCANWRANGGQTKSTGHSRGGCDATCRDKCDLTWRAGGYKNVQACYAKWSRLNANPELAQRCEDANRARGWKAGPC